MALTITMTLVARPGPAAGRWIAEVRHVHGDDSYAGFSAEGASADEARGRLLRELIAHGMDEDAVFLRIATEEA